MKDKNFIVKVGDLLQEGGKSDAFDFEWKLSWQLPGLTKKGISGTVVLRSLNQDSLYVTLENISCELEDICDRCWTTYTRTVNSPEYISRFVISEERKKEEQDTTDEEIFVINARDETIDLEPMIVQSIKLQDPFVKHCSVCEKKAANESEEEDIEEWISWGNIIFH